MAKRIGYDNFTKSELIAMEKTACANGKTKVAERLRWAIQDRLDQERRAVDPSFTIVGYTGRNSNK